MGGVDNLDGGAGGDTISAGAGDDIVDDGSAAGSPNSGNLIHGDTGNDSIIIGMPTFVVGGNPSNNVAFGDDGDDSVAIYYAADIGLPTQGETPSGHSFLHGGAGNDTLRATIIDYGQSDGGVTRATASLYGDAGNDSLWATSWAVTNARSDYVQDNYDYLYGGPGSDNYHVFEAKDAVIEKVGEGYDTITAYQTDYTLPANVERLVMAFVFPSLDNPPPAAR